MSGQKKLVIDSLKKILKSKGITYEMLAKKLELSLPAVKTMLSKEDMTLSRLEHICEVMNIKMTDVFRLVETVYEGVPEELSLDQENYFAKNPARFAYLDLLLNGMTIKQIETQFKLSTAQTAKILRDLEKVGVIDWLSDTKIKLKVSSDLRLNPKGPLRTLYGEVAIKSFLDSDFSKPHEYREFMTLKISEKTMKKVGMQIRNILHEANREGDFENQTGVKTENAGVYVALRGWRTADAFGL